MEKFVPMFVRPETKKAFTDFANLKRMGIYQAADCGAEALAVLTPDQERRVIERPSDRSPRRRQRQSA